MARRDTPLTTDGALHEYCNVLRRELGIEFKYLEVAALNLRATLSPHGKVRAWIVAAQVHLAAECAKRGSAHAVATYMAFRKHFAPELAAAARKAGSKQAAKDKTKAGHGFMFGSGASR